MDSAVDNVRQAKRIRPKPRKPVRAVPRPKRSPKKSPVKPVVPKRLHSDT